MRSGKLFSSSVFSSYIRDNPDYRSIFRKADAGTVVSELNGLFNSISYEKYPVKNEKAVQSYMHVFMMGGNLPVRTEVQSASGRADIVLDMTAAVWCSSLNMLKQMLSVRRSSTRQ